MGKSYQMRVSTNTCQEISKRFKCILEKGEDNKEKLHGLNPYCGYSLSRKVKIADVAHFSFTSKAINRAPASASLLHCTQKVPLQKLTTLPRLFHGHTPFLNKKLFATVL